MEQKVPPGTTIFDLKRYMPPYDGPDAVTAFDVLRDVHLLFVYLLCLILSTNAAKDYIKRFQLDGYPAGAQLQVNVRLPFSSPHSYIYTCSLSLSFCFHRRYLLWWISLSGRGYTLRKLRATRAAAADAAANSGRHQRGR